eukprot:Gb_36046 [translate_table: standard]
MLLESALADFSALNSEKTVINGDNSSPGEIPKMANDQYSRPGRDTNNSDLGAAVSEVKNVTMQNPSPRTRSGSQGSPDLQILEDFMSKRLTEREKQISVDPQSLNSYRAPGSVPFKWEMEPGVPKVKVRVASFTGPLQPPPGFMFSAPKFSATILNSSSATQSPRSNISGFMRSILNVRTKSSDGSNISEGDNSFSPVSILDLHTDQSINIPSYANGRGSNLRKLARQHSLALARAVDSHVFHGELRRAKSYIDPRSNSVGFELFRAMGSINRRNNDRNSARIDHGSPRPRSAAESLYDYDNRVPSAMESLSETDENHFTCGGMCRFLPFAKQKSKQKSVADDVVVVIREDDNSMEKFDCGDCTPASVYEDEEEEIHVCFDRAINEFVQSGDEAFSPVSTAFVFDGGRQCPPSVLKKTKSQHTKRPSRHVRFSLGALSSSSSSLEAQSP